MKSKFYRNKLFSVGIFVFLMLFIVACSSSSDTTAAGTYPVTLLQTTDMHSHASGFGPSLSYSPMATGGDATVLGGFARLAAKIKEIRTAKTTAGSAVLLVDSGDYLMGTVYDFLWNTNPASLQFIQAMQYDLITLGNHEFDYGPVKLATMINASKASVSGFTVPIVASNTDFTGATDLVALQTNGSIIPTFVKTLPNGLKIGFIGLMGSSANTDSPNAPPVTFHYDYAGVDKAYVQGIVDHLRNDLGANVVIALSHSGIIPGATPTGDDITLAKNITGIDIIASGHVHIMTPTIIDQANTATPSNITHIFCAGQYTTNLAQLDFTATATGVTGLVLTNHPIDNTIAGDSAINTMVLAMNSAVNDISGIPLITDVEQTMGAFPLSGPSSPGENGLGNMIADALRYAGTAGKAIVTAVPLRSAGNAVPAVPAGPEFTIGAFATGVIRDPLIASQSVAFADLFAVVPLGITTATDQLNFYPGYPLLKVYLTGAEIWDMCRFDGIIMVTGLFADDFIHLSGIQYAYHAAASPTFAVVDSVQQYAPADYKCTGKTTAVVADTTLYPVIIDSYVMSMLLSPSIQGLITALGISVHPKLVDGSTLVSSSNMLDTRLDKDAGTAGVQEYYAWSALLDYFTSTIASGGLSGAAIPAEPYNFAVRTSPARINPTP